MKLLVENIRSFAGPHEFEIRPLTLLVGENSSGKSTLLAALAAVSDPISFPNVVSLNKAPYDLGTFDTIATYKGGRSGRAKSFSLGFRIDGDRGSTKAVEVIAAFCSDDGEARLRSLSLKDGPVSAVLTWEKERVVVRISGLKGAGPFETLIKEETQQFSTMTFQSLVSFISTSVLLEGKKFSRDTTFKMFHQLQISTRRWAGSAPRATSISPIRSEPKRTYDRLSDEYDPSGDHIPFVLARLLQKGSKGEALHEALLTFGQDSGLFKGLNVKRLGTKAGDPFQVQITVGGPSVNLSDVGYGVSQSLPIIVESILRVSGSRILLQQPEVHLHPRAQAALGSFFSQLVSKEQREFVIETHSDYLIDRVRQEVAEGRLPAEAVSILFFERPHIETTVATLTLDNLGNIQNAPPSYRAFFLEEELRLLSRGDRG